MCQLIASASITSTADLTTTGILQTNTAPGAIQSAMIYSQCTSPSNFNLIVSAVQTGLNVLWGITFWYADSANTLASATQGLTLLGGNIYDVLDIRSQYYAVFADNGQHRIYELSVLLGSYSLSIVNSGTTPTDSRGSCRDFTSSYSYYGPKSSTTKISKFDASDVNSYNMVLTYTVPAAADRSVTTLDFGPANTLFYFGNSAIPILVSVSSMTASKTFASKTYTAHFWTRDNTNTSSIFAVIESSGSVYSIQNYDLTQASTTLTSLNSGLPLAGSAGYGTRLLNFGPYKYIGFATTVSGNPTLLLARKKDLTVVSTTVHPGMVLTTDSVSPLTLTQSTNPSQGVYRINAIIDSGAYNMFVYTVNFLDNCALASSSNAQCEEAINGYFIDTTTGNLTCIDVPSISSGKGLSNTIPPKVVFCVDINCITCTYNASFCMLCSAGYYNSFGVCQLITSIPDGYGFDPVSLGKLACQSTGCRVCQADYQQCTACYQPTYYLDTAVCYLTSSLPAGQGLVPATGGFGPCLAGAACLDCRTDYSICVGCDQVAGYYRLVNTCSTYASIPTGYGIKSSDFSLAPCTSAGCLNCKLDYQVCTICENTPSARFYLDGTSCKDQTSIPVGFGYDTVTGTAKPCLISGCHLCSTDYQQCEICDSNQAAQIGSSCTRWENFPAGFGYDSLSKTSLPCASTGCLKCAKDFKKCTQCDDSVSNILGANKDYCLESSACEVSTVGCLYTFTAQQEACSVLSSSQICLKLTTTAVLPDNLPISQLVILTGQSLSPEAQLTNTMYPQLYELTKTIGTATSWLTLDLSFADRTLLKEENYHIVMFTSNPRVLTTNIPGSRIIRVELLRSTVSFFYKEPLTEEYDTGRKQGLTLRSALGGPAVGSGLAVLASWGAMALDPSGLLLKVSQLLKLVSRLFYLNVAYGHRLNGFLSGLNNLMLLGQEETPAEVIMNSGKWRGKLSKHHYSLSIVKVMLDKCLIYLFSACFNTLLVILQRYQVSKPVLYLMYYWPKVHCLIYSVVIYDFFMLGFRTALHSRSVSGPEWLVLYCVGIFMSVDTFETFRSVFELNRWKKKLLRDYNPEEKEFQTIINSQASPTKVTNRNSKASKGGMMEESPAYRVESSKAVSFNRLVPRASLFGQRDSLKVKLPLGLNPLASISEIDKQVKLIDYSKTYEEININYHLMALQTSLLRPDAATYQPLVARALFLQAVFRTNLVSLVILAGQYLVTSLLTVTILIELGFIGALVFIGFKHQHMRSKILYVADMVQRLSLTIFLSIALMIHLKATSADENKRVGDTVIVIVIIACASEYLGVFLYFVAWLGNRLLAKYKAAKSAAVHAAGQGTERSVREKKHLFLRFKEHHRELFCSSPLANLHKRESIHSTKHTRKSSHDKQSIGTPKVNKLSIFSSTNQKSPQVVFNRIVRHQEKTADHLSTDRNLVGGRGSASHYVSQHKPYQQTGNSPLSSMLDSNLSVKDEYYPRSRFSSAHNMMSMNEPSTPGPNLVMHNEPSHIQDTGMKEEGTSRLDTKGHDVEYSVRLENTPVTQGVGISSHQMSEYVNGEVITIRRLPADKYKHQNQGQVRESLLGKLKAAYMQSKEA